MIDAKLFCPECLYQVSQYELDTFGGLCEECSGAFDDEVDLKDILIHFKPFK